MLESVSEGLAARCERCPCHERFSIDRRADAPSYRRVLASHFGVGVIACPMSGKRAPELAVDGLDGYLGVLWNRRFSELLCAQHGQLPLSPAESADIASDLEAGRANLHLQLATKLDYWSRLPWYLAGLAHCDEARARQCAVHALHMFSLDPRREAHHRLTWQLLANGSPLRVAIDKFAEGEQRASIPVCLLRVVAAFRFVPIVETTIEGKHARLSLESTRHLGPARVSLSNRLRLIERILADSPESSSSFVRCFDTTRRLRSIPALLGFSDHPALAPAEGQKRLPLNVLAKRLAEIIYRCDLDSLFRTMHSQQRSHLHQQRIDAQAQARLRLQHIPPAGALAEETVRRDCLMNHFRARADPAKIYSLPLSAATLQPLGSYLAGASSIPSCKRQCVVQPDDLMPDVHEEAVAVAEPPADGPPGVPELMYFRIINVSQGSKKFVSIAPGAGRKVQGDAFAVTYHKVMPTLGATFVQSTPSDFHDRVGKDHVALLTALTDLPLLEDSFLAWDRAPGLTYILPSLLDCDAAPLLATLVTSMVNAGAVPGAGIPFSLCVNFLLVPQHSVSRSAPVFCFPRWRIQLCSVCVCVCVCPACMCASTRPQATPVDTEREALQRRLRWTTLIAEGLWRHLHPQVVSSARPRQGHGSA